MFDIWAEVHIGLHIWVNYLLTKLEYVDWFWLNSKRQVNENLFLSSRVSHAHRQKNERSALKRHKVGVRTHPKQLQLEPFYVNGTRRLIPVEVATVEKLYILLQALFFLWSLSSSHATEIITLLILTFIANFHNHIFYFYNRWFYLGMVYLLMRHRY
jgi:hypothetical protein